jgi:hypothetical protein
MPDETTDSSGKSKIAKKVGAVCVASVATVAGFFSSTAPVRNMNDGIDASQTTHTQRLEPNLPGGEESNLSDKKQAIADLAKNVHDFVEVVADVKKRKDERANALSGSKTIGGNSYMYDKVIRDPDEMIKFAQEVDEYCEAMQRVCGNLRSNLSAASPMMSDDKCKKALQKIEVLASELISGLPEARDTAEKLRSSAKELKQIQLISF